MPHRTQAFTETFTSSANTTDQENTVFTNNEARTLEVVEVKIAIESGAGSAVGVAVFHGEDRMAPEDGPVDIAGEVVSIPCNAEVGPGNDVVARHDNSSATARDVTVLVVTEMTPRAD